MSCGLYALSTETTLTRFYCSAVYAVLDTGLLVEEVFCPLSKCETREVFRTCPVAVLKIQIRIRIRRIRMFLGLLDPDPLVRGMDPDLDPSIINQK